MADNGEERYKDYVGIMLRNKSPETCNLRFSACILARGGKRAAHSQMRQSSSQASLSSNQSAAGPSNPSSASLSQQQQPANAQRGVLNLDNSQWPPPVGGNNSNSNNASASSNPLPPSTSSHPYRLGAPDDEHRLWLNYEEKPGEIKGSHGKWFRKAFKRADLLERMADISNGGALTIEVVIEIHCPDKRFRGKRCRIPFAARAPRLDLGSCLWDADAGAPDGDKFADLTLICEGERIRCHRFILAAR